MVNHTPIAGMALSLSKRVRNIARFRDIMAVLAAHGFDQLVDQLELEERAIIRNMIPARERDKTPARRFVEALEELGPTFIKLGQILSTRPDLLPEDLIVELKKLQSHVKEEPFEEIRKQIEASVDEDLDQVFERLDEKPLAAASVAQVHRATLRRDGRQVVLKVLRPGIREVIENDLDILYFLAGLAERHPEARLMHPRGVVREFERAMTRELDLTHELANIRRFRQNFAQTEWMVIPEPIDDLSTRNMLVMDFLDGVPFTDFEKVGAARERIARRGVAGVFKMAFDDGFFHADPHPGNVLALAGSRIGMLDMGLAGRVDRVMRDKVISLLAALVQDDPDRIAEAVYAFGEATAAVDFNAFKKDVLDVYEDELRGRELRHVAFGKIISRLFRISSTHKMGIPADLTLLFKSLVTIEGVAKEVYPELDVLEEARPFVKRLLMERYSPDRLAADVADLIQSSHSLLQALPRRMDRLLGDLEQGRLVIRVEEADPRRSAALRERAAARLAIGIASAGFVLASAVLLVFGFYIVGAIAFIASMPLGLWTLYSAFRPRKR